jgi:hypothetical protein
MKLPDESHLVMEGAIRGLCHLLPEEGYAGWQIKESQNRSATTKILRVERDGIPFLAFDRDGKVFDFWFAPDSLHLIKLYGPDRRTREVGHNAGYHSNIDSFFQSPEYLWKVRLTTVDNAVALLEDLKT